MSVINRKQNDIFISEYYYLNIRNYTDYGGSASHPQAVTIWREGGGYYFCDFSYIMASLNALCVLLKHICRVSTFFNKYFNAFLMCLCVFRHVNIILTSEQL